MTKQMFDTRMGVVYVDLMKVRAIRMFENRPEIVFDNGDFMEVDSIPEIVLQKWLAL